MTKRNRWKTSWVALLFCTMTAVISTAQTFITLARFNEQDGAEPFSMSLVQGINGNFYGTTASGGVTGYGTVFEITPTGKLTRIYSFCTSPGCPDGRYPQAGLALAVDGNLYGTTSQGGTNQIGTIFKITPRGTLTTLYTFAGTHGGFPHAGLVQGSDGNFYGTTVEGGSGYGSVFAITPGGKLTTLYDFCSQPSCTDGEQPFGGLIQGTDGNFYGTTSRGGSGQNDYSTVFEITPQGKLTTLYTFCSQPGCADGTYPQGTLVQAVNGNFYGTTTNGGYGSGTAFEITPSGNLTTLYFFCSLPPECSDGQEPWAGLIQATDGNLYGTSPKGGNNNGGTLFGITLSGTLENSYSLCFPNTCEEGYFPIGGFLQATNGKFYGTASAGGDKSCAPGCGTVFSVDMGLEPFVAFVRAAGKVGQTGGVLGQGFTGTTAVLLNGTPAEFTVVSDTYIKAKVPPGATTGYVTVTTPTGVLTSNVPFHVIR